MIPDGVCDGCQFRVVDEKHLHDEIAFSSAPLDGLSIFLAEDEFINQRMISFFLRENGALVTLCENGLELLLAQEKSQPDLILTDVSMPVMDGLEAVRQIRESERCLDKRNIPIIALTAHDAPGYDVTCFTAGMDAYLTKSLDPARLILVIHTLIGRREYVPAKYGLANN